MNTRWRILISNFVTYFLRGLLVLAPLGLTIYILYKSIAAMDNLVNDAIEIVFEIRIPGLGFIIMILLIFIIGIIASTIVMQYILRLFELLLNQTPFTRWIYSSLKDLFGAFVSGKRKFEKPVLLRINKDSQLYKLGFITQEDLHEMEIHDMIAVYVPHSYNISGDLYIVPRENITPVNGINSAEAMKFIVSGGITNLED